MESGTADAPVFIVPYAWTAPLALGLTGLAPNERSPYWNRKVAWIVADPLAAFCCRTTFQLSEIALQ